jgi:predicted RNA-binding Zn-ribbon protein involved in translation (DUF1610 family)
VPTGQAGSRVRLQPPEKESKPLCSVISNPCAQYLKPFRVRTQEKSCCDAKLSRVAGFRSREFGFCILSICQGRRFCRNVPFAMSSREVNIRALQRSWARRSKVAGTLSRPVDAQVQYSCPSCGSENTQRLSTAYMSGVSSFSAVMSGFGWAGGPAGGSGWLTGVSQTQMSEMAAPPPKKRYRGALLLLLSSPFLGPAPFALLESLNGVRPIYEEMAVALGTGFLIAALLWLGSAYIYNKRVWPTRCREWHRRFLCLRCGMIFVSS